MKDNKRILDLAKKLDAKTETYLEKENIPLEEAVLKKYNERFKKLALHKENAYPSGGASPVVGAGQTVNSFVSQVDSLEPIKYNQTVKQPIVNSSLTPKEAFEISIKRTLDSGNPINNISFYDEVNWHLQGMGFLAKLPIDIKSAINDMLKYGEIK